MNKITIKEAQKLKEGTRVVVKYRGNEEYCGTIKKADESDLSKHGVSIGDTLIIYDDFGFDNLHDDFENSVIGIYLQEEKGERNMKGITLGRKLTLEEIRLLADGTKVWVEEAEDSTFESRVHIKNGEEMFDDIGEIYSLVEDELLEYCKINVYEILSDKSISYCGITVTPKDDTEMAIGQALIELGEQIIKKNEINQMSKQDFIDWLNGKKIAIKCDTEEKAKRFVEMSHDLGIAWLSGFEREKTRFDNYKEKTCYTNRDGKLLYTEMDYYKGQGYKIVKF